MTNLSTPLSELEKETVTPAFTESAEKLKRSVQSTFPPNYTVDDDPNELSTERMQFIAEELRVGYPNIMPMNRELLMRVAGLSDNTRIVVLKILQGATTVRQPRITGP